MSTSNNTSSNGIGLLSILGIVFIILKLTHTIDWSWWWVTAPFWIPLIFWILFFIIVAIIKVIIVRKYRKRLEKLLKK